jgi:hypothetical protein
MEPSSGIQLTVLWRARGAAAFFRGLGLGQYLRQPLTTRQT